MNTTLGDPIPLLPGREGIGTPIGRIPASRGLPVITGVIDRRILVNFRVAPSALERLLPRPFRPKVVRGWGMAGICLIRLRQIRPRGLPAWCGLGSENAAHRIAVEWHDQGLLREGVFIPRRDTSSVLNRWAGGKVFPGVHHQAAFTVWEAPSRFKIELASADGFTFVRVAARVADKLPSGSVFETLEEASEFFARGSLGWSVGKPAGELDGLELCCAAWQVEPLIVERVETSFFENRQLFPSGAIQFDNALLMRGIQHEWHARGRFKVEAS